MRTVPALLALALATVFPLAAHAEDSKTTASVASHGGDMAGRLGYVSSAPYAPSLLLELRAAAGHDDALLGPVTSFYRMQPELLFGMHPAAHVEIFAGGGVGSAYVVPDYAWMRGLSSGPTFTVSGALGTRFPLERLPVTAVARAQSVGGYGMALTIDVAVNLAAKP